jgi:hypothetical protein
MRVCFRNSDDFILESQSGDSAGLGVLIANAVAAGYAAEDVRAEILPDAEFKLLLDAQNAAEPKNPTLQSVGLVRFTAGAPASVLENIGLGPVTRLAKGRFRCAFSASLASDAYAVIPSVFDAAVRSIRVTARTAAYCEVRVTDLAGAAADAAEVTVKIERVVAI